MAMRDVLNNVYSLGVGAASASKEQIERTVNELVQRGEVKRSESNQLVDDLMEKRKKSTKRSGINDYRTGKTVSCFHGYSYSSRSGCVESESRYS